MTSVYFYYATMGAGKTAHACITAFNYEEVGLKPLCITSAYDTRYIAEHTLDSVNELPLGRWESRISELSRDAYILAPDENVINIYNKVSVNEDIDVIIVDETQFLSKEQIENIFKIALYLDIPIICYGLLTDFKTELFESSKRLIELGAKLKPLKSIGRNGKKTVINGKFKNDILVTKGDVLEVGGNDKYRALTLDEYWNLSCLANSEHLKGVKDGRTTEKTKDKKKDNTKK